MRAELTRLQNRQALLLHQQAAFEQRQEELKAQQGTLEATRRQLAEPDETARQAPESAPVNPQRPAPITAATTAPQSPALLSFGMAD
ncbi:hypothetical protein D3C78_1500570 [compost metagenome]